ncbi:MAG: M16 family metallopeptidase, partial [Iodobacter sp.]
MRCILCFILLLASPSWAAWDVHQGQLANGFKYVIKKSDQPAGKVEIRLVVKVGSRHEAEDEKGIAHLVEHMAFRRSTHFAAGEIAAFLNSQGMRWSNDSNAFTTWEHTVYQLRSNSSDMDKALLLSRDWAGGIQFNAGELALERKIVLDEMRLQQNAQRSVVEYLDLFYPGREYSQRMPIGDASVIENLPSARIAGFYHRHYIAPRMTLLVVGDVDEAAVEKIIKARFASVAAGPVPAEPAKAQPARQRLLHTDYKALGFNNSFVSWGWVEEWDGVSTGAGMQRDHLRFLLLSILERRLKAKSNTGNYSDAVMFREDSIPHLQIWTLVALPAAEKAGSALEELRSVVEQARRTGFSAQEIDEVRQLMSGNEEALAKRVHGQADLMAYFQSVATEGGHIESPEQRLQGWNAAMKLATPARLQAELDTLMKSPGQLIKIMRSPNDSSTPFGYFTEEDIEQMDLRVQKQVFEPWVHQESTGKLLETPP